jgi:hypothetical protein
MRSSQRNKQFVGSFWDARYGCRSIEVVAELPPSALGRRFVVRHLNTGRLTRMSLMALMRNFRERRAPDG